MKKNILIVLVTLFHFSFVQAQTITTIAGTGVPGYSGDGGKAINAQLGAPAGLAFDTSGNIYIGDYGNNVIREITVSTGIINTIAGDGYQGYSGDGGQATAAELYYPWGSVIDTMGNVFISDYGNNRIRKVAVSTGIITTIAGNGTGAYSGNGGQASAAEISQPAGIVLDRAGDLYMCDASNNRIRKINMSTGIITLVAGTGARAYSGDGGQATAAKIAYPTGIAVDDSDNLYIADWANSRIRKITNATGIISTVAGTGKAGYSGDGGQATSAEINEAIDVKVDKAGNIYIADWMNNRIREVVKSTGVITTIAGTGVAGYTVNGGPATSAELDYPDGLVIDATGNVYLADAGYSIIREITGITGIQELNNLASASVYPNPNSGSFTIALQNVSGKSQLEIYNVLGEKIYQDDLNHANTEVNLGSQSTGVYFYRILSEDGKLVSSGKLLISK